MIVQIFSDAVAAMKALAETLERLADLAARGLAPADDPAVTVDWIDGDGYAVPTQLTVTLQSGRQIRGSGAARLEAIEDAQANANAGPTS